MAKRMERRMSQNRSERKKPVLHEPKSAADFLNTKASTLAVWRCTGRYNLPFVKMGSRVLYDEQDLIEFIERRKQTSD
jgi:hypothetical protein